MPQEVEASTRIGADTAGYLFRTYWKDRPRLRCSTLCQIRNAVRVNGGTAIWVAGLSWTTNENTHESRGRQNGSTQAAKLRLPANCSSCLDVVTGAEITDWIRDIYLARFVSPRRQERVPEQYSKPKITNSVAGPRDLAGLISVAVARPTIGSVSISIWDSAWELAPPKASSTYEPSTEKNGTVWRKRWVKDVNHRSVHAQNYLELLALTNGIAKSM